MCELRLRKLQQICDGVETIFLQIVWIFTGKPWHIPACQISPSIMKLPPYFLIVFICIIAFLAMGLGTVVMGGGNVCLLYSDCFTNSLAMEAFWMNPDLAWSQGCKKYFSVCMHLLGSKWEGLSPLFLIAPILEALYVPHGDLFFKKNHKY